MNYEAGTEERKGLTKCLNFKRPETILGVQAAHSAPLLANIYTDPFFFRICYRRRIVYFTVYCRDLARPKQFPVGRSSLV